MKLLKIISVICLGVLFLFSLAKLYGNINRFGTDSVQVDFSVYYTTGQNLNADFPLYKNGIVANPPIWDGLDEYIHSRYLYPPLAAVPFALMAGIMPYGSAKFFWMYFSLACLIASIFLTVRALKLKLVFWHYLAIGIYGSLFFPLLTSLERGQIDNLTLLLALIATSLVIGINKREIASGFFWAFATLIKLHIGFVVLFFILRKQWKMLVGYVFGGIAIIALTFLFLEPNSLGDYLTKEFPRIAKYGEAGTTEMKLPESYFEKYYGEYAQGKTSGLVKDGQWYKGVHLSFAPNASLSRFIVMRMQDINKNWQISPSLVSILLLALFIPIAFFGLRKIRTKISDFSSEKEFLYWYAILMILMLFGPLTWTMNAVWIIPLSALAVSRNPWSNDKMHIVPWLLLVSALILAFVPDCMYLGWRNFDAPSIGCKMLDSSKYIFSELMIIASIVFQITGVPWFNKKHISENTNTE